MSRMTVVGMISLLAFALPAFAQTRNAYNGSSGSPGSVRVPDSNGRYIYQDVQDWPAVDIVRAVDARAQAAQTRAQFRRARESLYDVVDRVREDMELTPELMEARRNEQAAWDAYQSARRRVLEGLRSDADYTAALDLRNMVWRQLEDMREQNPLPTRSIEAAAKLKLEYSAVASEIEAEALANDDGVQNTKIRLIEASQRTTQVFKSLDRGVRRDPVILASRESLEDARVAKITAGAYSEASTEAAQAALDFSYELHRYDRYKYLSYPSYGYGQRYGYAYRYPCRD
ncbi:MAG: hypothetical protein ACREIT_00095 [Tepidisphaeraceae bacterium]